MSNSRRLRTVWLTLRWLGIGHTILLVPVSVSGASSGGLQAAE